MATSLRQKNAIANLVANGGNKAKAMRDAKYSAKTARNPKKLTESEGFKEEAKPFLDELEAHRKKVIARMNKTINKAQYQHLNSALDTTTKLIQLLGGKETEIVKVKGINYIVPEKND